MTAAQLLTDFALRGIQIVPCGNQLVVSPVSSLTDEGRVAIRLFKPELIRLLTDPYERAKKVAKEAKSVGHDLVDHCRKRAPETPSR
jgi:hypothetical protein